MSHIPEDRHKHGLVLDYTPGAESRPAALLAARRIPERAGFIKSGARCADHAQIVSSSSMMCEADRDLSPLTGSMSGGNQQKAIIAREIDKAPELLVAVQPTRGLDVGAIEYIHKQLVAQRDRGKAVLLVSLELDEVMDVSDRILVMYEGELVGAAGSEEGNRGRAWPLYGWCET